MTSVRLVVSLVAAALLAAPGALAASARGELEAGAVELPDGATVTSAGLDLVSEGALPELTIDATGVSVHRLGTSEVQVGGVYRFQNENVDERAEYDAATLTLLPGAGDAIVAVRALGPATTELASSLMLPVAGAHLASALDTETCADAFDPLYCMDVRGVYELAGDLTATLAGETTLLLYGPTLRVASGGQTVDHASGETTAQDGLASENTWIVVRATSATGTFAATAARAYHAAPTVQTSAAELTGAEGLLRVGGRDYRAADDTVVATGAITLTPGPVSPATGDEFAVAPVYASAMSTRITGDVQSINLNAANAFLDSPAEKGIVAALVGLAIAGLAYAWQHVTFLAAALYTRLNKPDILDNDVRNRIYDIIRENPGISAREVHRRSEQSWGTVVYHLRQLERHHLVVSRSLGRTRNYYENHGKYRGMEVQLACLQSDRARTLARAIATAPGITQEQLAASSGYPQPTTSYYVRKLKQAGLVEEQREGRYVKYVPHADLPRFIAISESAAAVPAAAPSGVQA